MGEYETFVLCINGHECPSGAKFCSICGQSVVPNSLSYGNGLSGASDTADSFADQVPIIVDAANVENFQGGAISPTKKGKRVLIAAGVAVVAVVVAGVSVAVYSLMGSSGKSWDYGPLGTVVIDPSFDLAGFFADNGLAMVERDGDWGYINTDGTFVVAPQFTTMPSHFFEGLASVLVGDKWGFIDQTGKLVISPQFKYPSSFSEGLASVEVDGANGYGFIDTNGDMAIVPQYELVGDFHEGLAAMRVGAEWGFIDTTGKIVIAPEFDAVGLGGFVVGGFREGLAVVKVGDKYGYIDSSGAFAINPKFDRAYDFSEGLAAVESNGVWKFINAEGDYAFTATFTDVYFIDGGFSEGLATVEQDGFLGVIDVSGAYVVEPTPDFTSISPFSGGFAGATNSASELEGLLDRNGQWALQPRYTGLGTCSQGLASFTTSRDRGPWGYISCG